MACTAPAAAQEAEPTLPEIEVVAPPEADPAAAPKPAKKPAAKKPKAAAKKPAPAPAPEPDVLPPEDADALAAGGAAGGPTGPGADVPGMPGTGTTGIDGYTARGTSTATKTNTPLIDIPQSITVVTKKQAEDRGSFTVGEVLRYVPGIAVAQGEGHRDQITIRGQNTTADFFVDGVRDDIEYFRDIYNVETIEVLKGPAAMIFGRGGGGGVINRVTKKADGERIREATVTLGSFERARTTIDVGDKISPDAAFRINAMYEDSESFRDFFELERYGINPTMAFRLSDQTKVSMSYEYFSDERTTDRGVPSVSGTPGRPFRGPIESFYGNPDESQSDFAGHTATATIEHRTDFGLNLRNHSFYANYEKFYSNVYAASAVNAPAAGPGNYLIEGYSMGTDRETFVNQTDATYRWDMGNGIRHTLLAGTEISFQDTVLPRDRVVFDPTDDTRCINGNGNACGRLIVPVAAPTDFTDLAFSNPERRWATDVSTYSGYIQDQLEITDYFEIIAGLRFDRFDVSAVNSTPTVLPPLGPPVELNRVDDVWSHRVGAVFKPTDTASVYIATSTSFLPGVGDQFINLGNQGGGVTADNLVPEEFQNNEIGFKWEIAPRLFFTGAIFQLDRSNQVIPTGPQAGEQVGLTRTKGGELALTGYVTDQWQISAGWGHQIARVVEGTQPFCPGAGTPPTCAGFNPGNIGNELPFVPNNIYSLWNRYQFLPWFGAGLGIIHQDSSFASLDNAVELPSFTRVDAAFFFDINENWAAQINVENILDEEYFASAHNNNNISPGAPRQAFVTVRARF
jgi:catecholate siderophore receptor